MRSTMLKIFPVETHKDIQIAQMLFVEYAEFLKKDLSEYADLPWLIDYYRRRVRYGSPGIIINRPGASRSEISAMGYVR